MLTAFSVGCALLPEYSHGSHVRDGLCGAVGIALYQQISLLMPILEKARTRGIILLPDDMPDGPEPCPPPCAEKFIDAIPAVKADAKTIRLQNAVGVRKGRKEFGAAAVSFLTVRPLLSR